MYFAIEFSSLVKESPGSPIGYASDLLCGRKGVYTLDASRGTPLLFFFPFLLSTEWILYYCTIFLFPFLNKFDV